MCLYVRRSKSSIPSTFSDILDKSFLNEQTSLCSEERGKNLTEATKEWKLFYAEFSLLGKHLLHVSNVMRSKLNLRSDFVPKKIPAEGFMSMQ